MRIARYTVFTLLLISPRILTAQATRTSVPVGDAVNKALSKILLTEEGHPFHILVTVSEPENPKSPYQGSIEEWWNSSDQWRREVSDKDGLHQTVVFVHGKKTEKDEGDYYPLWLREFEIAISDPIPNVSQWTQPGSLIEQTTYPSGVKSQACVRDRLPVGTGERTSVAFSTLCFDESGNLQFIGTPRYNMEFHDYQSFGAKQVARRLVENPEPGTKLVGNVAKLKEFNSGANPDLFQELPQDDDRFHALPVSSEELEKLSAAEPPIIWPAVDHGSGKGHIAMYVSVDIEGKVREAWPLSSDDAGLEDPAREQVRKWTFSPARDHGGAFVQVDGPVSFTFVTTVGPQPLHLSNAETRALATKIVEPTLPKGVGQAGQKFEVEVSIDQQGKLAGIRYIKMPVAAVIAVNDALHKWTFHPLIQDGKPIYVHGTIAFIIR